jgi:5,10-methylenetetrahydromethanopterin reductase
VNPGPGRLKFGIAAGLQDVGSYQGWARLAERCGYDLIGYGDSQCLIPELCVGLTALATVTEHVLLCPTVTNPVTRHPSVMASAFSTLQQLSGGRTRFGMGSGDSAALSIGERPATLSELAEYGRAFNALTRGEEATYRGRHFRLEWNAPPVPMWLAAGGPRTMRLAGEIAEGVILGSGLTEAVVRDAIRRVRDGAVAAGRDPASVEVWLYAKIYLCDSEEQAWHDLAWTLAASAHHAFRSTFEGKFVPPEWHESLRRLQEGYVVREHNNLASAGPANAALVVDSGLTSFLGPRFLLAGPPERIVDRIEEIAGWGVSGVFTSGMFGDPFSYTSDVADGVMAPLRRRDGAR